MPCAWLPRRRAYAAIERGDLATAAFIVAAAPEVVKSFGGEYLVRGGRLITPDVSQGILEGVTRDTVMTLAREQVAPALDFFEERAGAGGALVVEAERGDLARRLDAAHLHGLAADVEHRANRPLQHLLGDAQHDAGNRVSQCSLPLFASSLFTPAQAPIQKSPLRCSANE